VAIGVGCKSNVDAETIARVVRKALDRSPSNSAMGLHTSSRKSGDEELQEAARSLGLDLVLHDDEVLRARDAEVVSRSQRIIGMFSVGSVAEAAALVGAGEGSHLVVPKFGADGVSCAIAVGPEDSA
jgi:cobalt-precorrin 5A hydrolase